PAVPGEPVVRESPQGRRVGCRATGPTRPRARGIDVAGRCTTSTTERAGVLGGAGLLRLQHLPSGRPLVRGAGQAGNSRRCEAPARRLSRSVAGGNAAGASGEPALRQGAVGGTRETFRIAGPTLAEVSGSAAPRPPPADCSTGPPV